MCVFVSVLVWFCVFCACFPGVFPGFSGFSGSPFHPGFSGIRGAGLFGDSSARNSVHFGFVWSKHVCEQDKQRPVENVQNAAVEVAPENVGLRNFEHELHAHRFEQPEFGDEAVSAVPDAENKYLFEACQVFGG